MPSDRPRKPQGFDNPLLNTPRYLRCAYCRDIKDRKTQKPLREELRDSGYDEPEAEDMFSMVDLLIKSDGICASFLEKEMEKIERMPSAPSPDKGGKGD